MIRDARDDDRDALSRICLETGADGGDATGRHADDRMLGDVFALPYTELDPAVALVVVDDDDEPVGYCVGTPDTAAFAADWATRWTPEIERRWRGLTLRDADAWLVETARHPERMVREAAAGHPAHLHIDLLPAAQGAGWGRRLVRGMLARVRERGAAGLHLGVSARNANARAFYDRIGFRVLQQDDGGLLLGIPTDADV